MSTLASLLGTLGGVAESAARAKQERGEEELKRRQIYSALEDAALRREHLRQTIQQAQGNPVLRLRKQLQEAGLTPEQIERYMGIAPPVPRTQTKVVEDKNSPTGRSYVTYDATSGQEISRQQGAPAPAPKPPPGAQLRQNAAGELEWFFPPTAQDPKGKVVGTGVKGKQPAPRANPLDALQNALTKSDYIAARKIVNDAEKDYLASEKLMRTMDAAKSRAILGDQQAQFAITANHILMTAGQKGGRVSQAMYRQAEESAPWLARVQARFGPDGYLSGVVLTPDQINSMVSLAHEKVRIQKQTLEDTKAAYAKELSARTDGGAAPPAPNAPTPTDSDPLGIRKKR